MEMEGDTVVKEIPVFVCKTLVDKLFIVQYPTRPAKAGYDDATFLKTCIKPENQEIRMEIALDIHSPNYDHSKGRQLAINADGECKNDPDDDNEKIFDSQLMDKIVLSSSRALPDCLNYAVGVFQDDELHITPLKGIVQMRPQFDYLDKSEKRVKDDTKGTGEDVDEDEDNPMPVKVTFSRPQPDHLKKMQEQSFQHHAKKSLGERWIHTNYIASNHSQAELVRMEMFYSSTEESVNTLNLSSRSYLNLLVPQLPEEGYSRTNLQTVSTSLSYIKTLPLLDQVRMIMKNARVMSFAQLRAILSTEHDTPMILKYLQQVAMLVQGNWIVNSELMYAKDSVSSQSGIPAELMCRARDYILLLFTEQQFLDRKTVSSVIKLPPEEIEEIFTNLGVREPRKGWQLLVSPNWEFCERYPEIAQRQEMLWDAKRKHLREAMEAQNQPLQRQRRKSNRDTLGSENEERNVGRGRKSVRDSLSDNDSATESGKQKKSNRSRKISETTT